MSEITITYETLFEMFRREKDRQDLQKLWDSFIPDVANYLKDKESSLNEPDLAPDEVKKSQIQIDNIKRVVKELYEKREKKIFSMALDRSRSRSDIFDTTVMLEKEREQFKLLVDVLNKGRNDILTNIIDMANIKDVNINITPKQEPKPEFNNEQTQPAEKKQETTSETPQTQPAEQKPTKMIRFLTAVPKFMGPNMEQYGPFAEEDMANLPTKIAEILISKERAEEIKEE